MWPPLIAAPPPPKSALTRATTLTQFVISAAVFAPFSSVSSSPVPPITASTPYIAASFTAAASSFCTYTNHTFKRYTHIPEGPLEWWFCSRFITHSLSSSVGTDSSNGLCPRCEGITPEIEEKGAKTAAEMTNWVKVVALVRADLGGGLLSEEATCQAVVLIPKGKGDYRGIGLVEVIWKLVAAILNLLIIASITYHDFLHGFLAGCGSGTATLEAKLIQRLSALREEVLYVMEDENENDEEEERVSQIRFELC